MEFGRNYLIVRDWETLNKFCFYLFNQKSYGCTTIIPYLLFPVFWWLELTLEHSNKRFERKMFHLILYLGEIYICFPMAKITANHNIKSLYLATVSEWQRCFRDVNSPKYIMNICYVNLCAWYKANEAWNILCILIGESYLAEQFRQITHYLAEHLI